MAVEIVTGPSLFTLTSPPPSPEPYPAEALIAQVMTYADRKIIVTIPFPDTIELVTDILNEHLESPWETGSAKSIYEELDKDFKTMLEAFSNGEGDFPITPKITPGSNPRAVFWLPYNPSQPLERARVELRRRKGPDYPIWSFKLTFNPMKAGPAGVVKLTAQIDAAVFALNMVRLRKSLRMSRLDAAVDCIGANPLDLIPHVAKPGKRAVYIGDSGLPETIYIYERKPHLTQPPKKIGVKTQGPLRVMLYERRDYHHQLGLPPPYGDCPVTRIEVSKRWKKDRPMFSGIDYIKNMFAGRSVTYAPPVGDNSKDWQLFCLAAFGAGVRSTVAAPSAAAGLRFMKLYASCKGDLVDQSCWERWSDGIAFTGLQSLMAGAAANGLTNEN